jgi:putative inorganic carbon (HCO3(-)) transporter
MRELTVMVAGGALVAATAAAATLGLTGGVLFLATATAFICGAIAVPQIRKVLLAAVVLDLALQWDVSLGFRFDAAQVGAEPGLNISLTTFALVALVTLWALDHLDPRTSPPALRLRPAVPLIVYVGISIISISVASDHTLGLFQGALLLQTLLLFLYVSSAIRSRGDFEFVLAVLMFTLAAESLLLLYLNVTDVTFDSFGLNIWVPQPGQPDLGYSRAGGTIGPPNVTAGFLAVLTVTAISVVWAPVSRNLQRLALLAATLGFPALLLTGSRGGWISFLVGIVILGAFAIRIRVIQLRTALLVAACAALLALPIGSMIAERVTGQAEAQSAEARIPLAEIGLSMVSDRPLLGVGLNNVGEVIPDYAGPQYAGDFIYTIHNKYLVTAAEAGIPALLAFLWFLGSTVSRGVRCTRSMDPLKALIGAGILAAICGQLVHMSVDIFTGRPQTQLLWTLAGMLVALEGLPWERAAGALPPDQLASDRRGVEFPRQNPGVVVNLKDERRARTRITSDHAAPLGVLATCLKELDLSLQSMLELRYRYELSYEAIASVAQINQSEIERLDQRALTWLVDRLDRRGSMAVDLLERDLRTLPDEAWPGSRSKESQTGRPDTRS